MTIGISSLLSATTTSTVSDQARIIVIDDQQSIHDAFRTVLSDLAVKNATLDTIEADLFDEPMGDKVTEPEFGLDFALQGKQGFEKVRVALCQETPFALAFVDMRMPPGWDGLETVEQLWKIDPQLQVVICTAYSDYTWEEVSRRLGRTDQLLLLKKPFANEEVYQLAVAMTEKWRLTKHLQSQVASLQETNARLETEICNRQLAEEQLRFMANYDRLTNLPNRFVLTDELERCIARKHRDMATCDALLFLDIDNFKLINDSLGHSAGDDLLMQVAERLSRHRRRYDVVSTNREAMAARLGGDEFVVLLEDLPSPRDAAAVAKRLNDVLQAPFVLGGREVIISTSIGIAVVDDKTTSAEEVFRNADTAMYEAKFTGKNRFALFDKEMHGAVVARLDLERNLRSAVQNREFELHFQPIISLDSLEISGFEALVRWRNGAGELIPPNLFIGPAEETGLIVEVGRWVMQEACQTLAKWNQQFCVDSPLSVSVNVSKRQFLEEGFLDDVRQILKTTGISGNLLHVEVTESVVMDNPTDIVKKLHELRDLGIRIHMDDFGTGHSSLSCLHQFPIDVLKIDKSFVSTMESNTDYAAIVEAIIVLAHNLQTKVIAEGIETADQLAKLVALGCDFGQGYYFAKPLPPTEAEAVLQSFSESLNDSLQ